MWQNRGMKSLFFALAASVVAVATFASTGCEDDHDHDHGNGGGHTSPYPSCNEITQACHSVDRGPGPINDCHSKAHDAKGEGDCAPIKAECLALCAAAADGGAGDGDAGDDGGATEGDAGDGGS